MKRRLFDLGRMRQRVKIYNTTRVEDQSGGFDRSDPSADTLLGTYWAHVEPVSARQREWGEQYTEVTSHVAWLRYDTQLTDGMTIGRVINAVEVFYYVEGCYDPNNLQEFTLLTLRQGGPM
jgi:head-tail adaptor